jgi:hypothetical protein
MKLKVVIRLHYLTKYSNGNAMFCGHFLLGWLIYWIVIWLYCSKPIYLIQKKRPSTLFLIYLLSTYLSSIIYLSIIYLYLFIYLLSPIFLSIHLSTHSSITIHLFIYLSFKNESSKDESMYPYFPYYHPKLNNTLEWIISYGWSMHSKTSLETLKKYIRNQTKKMFVLVYFGYNLNVLIYVSL